ncbi:hypothetical protein Mycsm_01774 [Mycobacterium sp. JS623]|uniref:DarT ssDNA thymidine ADP-ribosyltransferase family protein n=1 Tax=Mycobacterium sp. JS623 TaxID=212767 RepID=UPI0002A5AC52|nr:DarT ssDNA thymidine ADP-ribosyltransferase family protein [Mycobacterium sp. JS623]AGB22164.1 hypothetical protein Mycsm_01774 [Mycobacterium sp. JS623]
MSATVPTSSSGGPPAIDIDHEVAALIAERGITEVLHFTTAPNGLVGVCATGAVLSRDRLEEEKYIEHIYAPNCASRLKDSAWTDYVNLSISQVNKYMLDKSSKDWHPPETGMWWTVLSFDPMIMAHEGVHFTTTNNTYVETVKRGTGRDGLEALFADSMQWGHYYTRIRRRADMPAHLPTHDQAEVLYPHAVSLEYLRGIYVAVEDHIDDVKTWIQFFSAAEGVAVTHRPDVFA